MYCGCRWEELAANHLAFSQERGNPGWGNLHFSGGAVQGPTWQNKLWKGQGRPQADVSEEWCQPAALFPQRPEPARATRPTATRSTALSLEPTLTLAMACPAPGLCRALPGPRGYILSPLMLTTTPELNGASPFCRWDNREAES